MGFHHALADAVLSLRLAIAKATAWYASDINGLEGITCRLRGRVSMLLGHLLREPMPQ
jgi:hypothetical protein